MGLLVGQSRQGNRMGSMMPSPQDKKKPVSREDTEIPGTQARKPAEFHRLQEGILSIPPAKKTPSWDFG